MSNMCDLSVDFWLKDLLHAWHWNGFSPVWTRIWRIKREFLEKCFPQKAQMKNFISLSPTEEFHPVSSVVSACVPLIGIREAARKMLSEPETRQKICYAGEKHFLSGWFHCLSAYIAIFTHLNHSMGSITATKNRRSVLTTINTRLRWSNWNWVGWFRTDETLHNGFCGQTTTCFDNRNKRTIHLITSKI